MLLKGISFFLLLIPICTANSGFIVHCEGEQTTLSCLQRDTEGKVEIPENALWKKGSGERVIWTYYGNRVKGDTYTNRTVRLDENLSLSIDGCDQSDQGLYILCINGKPSCEVRLFVKDSKRCKPKTSTEQSTRSPAFTTMAKQASTDEKHLQTETSLLKNYKCGIYASVCLFGLSIVLLVACISREKRSKNDKTGPKLLHKDIQSNHASA